MSKVIICDLSLSLALSLSLSVILSVFLFVYPDDNSKSNDPKVFKLGVRNDLGITYIRWFAGQKVNLGLGLQKHTEGDRVADVSYALYLVPSL